MGGWHSWVVGLGSSLFSLQVCLPDRRLVPDIGACAVVWACNPCLYRDGLCRAADVEPGTRASMFSTPWRPARATASWSSGVYINIYINARQQSALARDRSVAAVFDRNDERCRRCTSHLDRCRVDLPREVGLLHHAAGQLRPLTCLHARCGRGWPNRLPALHDTVG